MIADTRTDKEWFWGGLRYEADFHHAETFAADVGSTGLFPVPTYTCCVFGIPYASGFVHADVGKGWRLPHPTEVLNLIAGWSDPSGSWLNWLSREIGATVTARYGAWSLVRLSNSTIPFVYGITPSGEEAPSLFSNPRILRGPLLVRSRTHNYW